MQTLQNEQPFQTANFLHHVCFINYYYSCSNCYYFTVPKRNVGFLSSVKDTIRKTRLKGATKADGILAVKYIKLSNLCSEKNRSLFSFPFKETIYFMMSLLFEALKNFDIQNKNS